MYKEIEIRRKDVSNVRKELENSMEELKKILLDLSSTPSDPIRFESIMNYYKMVEVIKSMKNDNINIIISLNSIKNGLELTLLEAALLFINSLINIIKNHLDLLYYSASDAISCIAIDMLNKNIKADDDKMQILYDFAIAHMIIDKCLKNGRNTSHSNNKIKIITDHNIDTDSEKLKLIKVMGKLKDSSIDSSLKSILYLIGESMLKYPINKCVIEFDGHDICLYQIAFEAIDSEIELYNKFRFFEREGYLDMPNAADILKEKLKANPCDGLALASHRNLSAFKLLNIVSENLGRSI